MEADLVNPTEGKEPKLQMHDSETHSFTQQKFHKITKLKAIKYMI